MPIWFDVPNTPASASASLQDKPVGHPAGARTRLRAWFQSPTLPGLWLGMVFGYLYVELITLPSLDRRRAFLDRILQGDAKSDYLYATYLIAQIQRFLTDHLPLSDGRCFALIDFAGIVFLFGCAGWFLGKAYSPLSSRIGGLLWLAVTSPLLLFQHHFYHPSDFYAVGLMFLILHAARHGRYLRLAGLCLVSGLLWEKTLFVPFIYLLWELGRSTLPRAILRALPALATTLFCFGLWRWAFPNAPRVYAYGTWREFLPTLLPAALPWGVWIVPVVAILADVSVRRGKLDRFWRLWLLYLPLLLGVIVGVRGQVGELRSFWILQPIFAGLVAAWAGERALRAGSEQAEPCNR
jgi:hypothetical protein